MSGPTATPVRTPRPAGADHTATTAVAVRLDRDGRSRFTRLQSSGLLALRPTPRGLYLLSASATPVGGDDVRFDIDVGPGACLAVRSAAASIARPGPDGRVSRLLVRARVGRRARLCWAPEPLVAAADCRHVSEAQVSVASGARLWWRDTLVAGRSGEEPGYCRSSLSVDVGGEPALRHELSVGGGSDLFTSTVVAGGARLVSLLAVVGDASTPSSALVRRRGDALASRSPLALPGLTLYQALAPSASALEGVVETVWPCSALGPLEG